MNFFKKKVPGGQVAEVPNVERDMRKDATQGHPDAPWIYAALHHDDRFLRMAVQVKNWRRYAFGSMALATLSVLGVIYIGSQSKIVPYIVEVDKLGRTLAVRAVGGKDAINDPKRLVFREMVEFVENCRTVTSDAGANNTLLTRAFNVLAGAAHGYVREELLKRGKSNDIAQSKTIAIKVQTAVPVTDTLWTVEWTETSYNLKGEAMPRPELWTANVHYEMNPGNSEDDLAHNPTGFKITGISWAKKM